MEKGHAHVNELYRKPNAVDGDDEDAVGVDNWA
ncbi:hypothetical protein BT93_C0468 [Corymbia citriodora subsp. variegata]|nr:hypothetical protein BT93_C0468 [Corymbia citriodora subsp. variegata]